MTEKNAALKDPIGISQLKFRYSDDIAKEYSELELAERYRNGATIKLNGVDISVESAPFENLGHAPVPVFLGKIEVDGGYTGKTKAIEKYICSPDELWYPLEILTFPGSKKRDFCGVKAISDIGDFAGGKIAAYTIWTNTIKSEVKSLTQKEAEYLMSQVADYAITSGGVEVICNTGFGSDGTIHLNVSKGSALTDFRNSGCGDEEFNEHALAEMGGFIDFMGAEIRQEIRQLELYCGIGRLLTPKLDGCGNVGWCWR